MSIPFSVGDVIKVKAGVTQHSITSAGTLLVIIKINKSGFVGRITKHLNLTQYVGKVFGFSILDLKNFELVTSLDTSDVNYKYRQVILKIRDMNRRRKESGYAY